MVGVSKSGIKGLGFIIVSLFALAFGAKQSTGLLVPLLIFADCFAVFYYKNNIVWSHLFKLMPPMAFGVLAGVFFGEYIPEDTFRHVLGVIILLSGIMMFIWDRLDKDYIPRSKAFALIMGLGAGFTTMVGNLAGSFSNLYFLAMRFPKNEFIGTAAVMFFIFNIFKLPFHIFVWETLDMSKFVDLLKFFPVIAIGFFVGLKIVKYFSNEFFKNYIIATTIIGAFVVIVKS